MADETEKKQPQPKKASKKKIKLKERVMKLLEALWAEMPDSAGKAAKFWKKTAQLLVAATTKFIRDESLVRATSIGYTVIISFVPSVVVVLLIGAQAIDLELLFEEARQILQANNIPLDPDPYFNVILEVKDRSGAIGGVGLLIMLFSATTVLRNIEKSLNVIFRVEAKRPFIHKISGFIMVLLFGPLVITLGISYGQTLIDQVSSPDLKTVRMSGGKATIVGDKRVILRQKNKTDWEYFSIINRIDYELQKKPEVIDPVASIILSENDKDKFGPELKKTTRSIIRTATFSDFARIDDQWWVVTADGSLLWSKDNGQQWYAQRFQRIGTGNTLGSIRFNRILMYKNGLGVIIGNNGIILRTADYGATWQPTLVPKLRDNLLDIARLPGGSHIIIGTNLTALQSNTTLTAWQPMPQVTSMAKKGTLRDILIKRNRVYIVGQDGLFLSSTDSGRSFTKALNMPQTYDFSAVAFKNEDEGILAGANGIIRYTTDGAQTFRHSQTDVGFNLVDATYDQEKDAFLVVGDSYHILSNKPGQLNSFSIVQESEAWRVLLTAVGNVLLPFIVIWLVFFSVYKIMPYTMVSAKAASVGAAVTSILWVVFILLFQIYVQISLKGSTVAVYGALAAIPIFLIMVYASTLIFLFGAEIAFYVQFPALVQLSRKKRLAEEKKFQVWYGIRILEQLFRHYEKGQGPMAESKLLKVIHNDQDDFNKIVRIFTQRGYMIRTEEGGWLPAMSPRLIKLSDLLKDLNPADYQIPDYNEKNAFMKEMRRFFTDLEKGKNEVFGKTTLADVIDKSFAS